MLKLTFAALAALVAMPAVAAPAGAFDGPFIGIQGGWQQDRQRLTTFDPRGVGISRDTTDGFAYGGQVGYDLRVTPQTVLGVEASATGRTGTSYFGNAFGTGYRLSAGRTFNVTGRAGFLVVPGGLVYARGGYSNARFDLNDGFVNAGQNRDGYTVGVGYEQAITRQVSARVEYNYSDYGSGNVYDAAYLNGGDTSRARYRRDAVSAGLNFHF